MRQHGRRFEGKTIRLDGNDYTECEFVDCVLEVGSAKPFTMHRCRTTDCEWTFVGAAADTISLLAEMYESPDHRELIEGTLQAIRNGTLPKRYAALNQPRRFDA